MALQLILALLVLASSAMAVALSYAHRQNASLREQMRAATDAHRSKDTLLVQRSELDQIKDEFISTVSHELRTPLTSIRGALGLLSAGLMGTVDGKAQNLLRIAVTNTDRLIRLINDILDLERMQSGRTPLHMRRCSLHELAQQAIETMTAMADGADVKLELVQASSADAGFVDGDADRILQVLTNLLSNAVKFSPAHGIVEVTIESSADSVLLRVCDQGRGIPIDKLDSVFDRFQQVEASDARQKGGTGLGLAICRTIVQQHLGSIWAESNVQHRRGPGACLVVSLPRASHARRAVEAVEATAHVVTRMSTPAHATVIVCDDDAGIRTVVGENLRQHGYRILEAENGEHAIELAVKNPVEAILLDLYMPGLNGWQTLQRLKNSSATAGIPVVVLSVLAPTDHDVRHAPERGRSITAAAQGWVQKPFNEDLLLAELSRVLHTGDGPAYVLLVEDDADLASVVIAGFEDAKVRVDHADSMQGAIDHCRLARPDLLILDLTLPDGDGFSLVDWLRRQPDLRTLPLVVYSGRDVSDSEMSKLQLGPTQFLTKAKIQPHQVEELVLNIVQRLRIPEIPTLT